MLQIDFMGTRDAFCLFYDAKTKTVKALNGSGRAPADLDIDYALSRGHKDRIPLTDLNSVTVPGQHMVVFLAQFAHTFLQELLRLG